MNKNVATHIGKKRKRTAEFFAGIVPMYMFYIVARIDLLLE